MRGRAGHRDLPAIITVLARHAHRRGPAFGDNPRQRHAGCQRQIRDRRSGNVLTLRAERKEETEERRRRRTNTAAGHTAPELARSRTGGTGSAGERINSRRRRQKTLIWRRASHGQRNSAQRLPGRNPRASLQPMRRAAAGRAAVCPPWAKSVASRCICRKSLIRFTR
jgi:hypothetical protein